MLQHYFKSCFCGLCVLMKVNQDVRFSQELITSELFNFSTPAADCRFHSGVQKDISFLKNSETNKWYCSCFLCSHTLWYRVHIYTQSSQGLKIVYLYFCFAASVAGAFKSDLIIKGCTCISEQMSLFLCKDSINLKICRLLHGQTANTTFRLTLFYRLNYLSDYHMMLNYFYVPKISKHADSVSAHL